MTATEAKSKLEEIGLFLRAVGVVDYADKDVKASAQVIQAGTMVKPGTVVEVRFVSSVLDFAYEG